MEIYLETDCLCEWERSMAMYIATGYLSGRGISGSFLETAYVSWRRLWRSYLETAYRCVLEKIVEIILRDCL